MIIESYEEYLQRVNLNWYIDCKFFDVSFDEDFSKVEKLKENMKYNQKEDYLKFREEVTTNNLEVIRQRLFWNEKDIIDLKKYLTIAILIGASILLLNFIIILI